MFSTHRFHTPLVTVTRPRAGRAPGPAAGAAAAVALALSAFVHAQDFVPLVQVDEVTLQVREQTVPTIGRLIATRNGPVSVRVSGTLAGIDVQPGDRVAQGQVLARLDSRPLAVQRDIRAAQLAEHESLARTREAELELAAMEHARLEPLQQTQAATRAQYEDARQQETISRARLGEARRGAATRSTELELARINLEYAEVVAPYAGIITRKAVEAGAYLNTGETVVDLLDDRSLEIEVEAPFNRVAGLEPGLVVDFEIERSGRYQAVVRAVIPDENQRTRTRPVRLVPRFGDTPPAAANGQNVTVHIPSGVRNEVLTLHKDAVIHRGGQTFVYVVKDGEAAITPVRLGDAVQTRLIAHSGVAAGDLVITRGNERLPPQGPVRIGPPPSQ